MSLHTGRFPDWPRLLRPAQPSINWWQAVCQVAGWCFRGGEGSIVLSVSVPALLTRLANI